MSMDVIDRSRRRLPRAERREQLLDAAAAAFAHGGFDGTSMDDVARAAGVTRLIVYRIFESKEALYRAVLDAVIADVVAEFSPTPPTEPVAQVLLRLARRRPDGFRLLWRQAAHEPAFAELARGFRASVTAYADQVLLTRIVDEQLRGWAAAAVVAHLYEAICLWLDHGVDESQDPVIVGMLTRGVRATVEQWERAATHA